MPLIRYSRGPRAALCLVALLAGLSVVGQAQAQSTYPQKPVRLIVPFAPGGASDILARTLGQKLSETTGQSFVIENKPGAGGTLGAELVAKSAADGTAPRLTGRSPAAPPVVTPATNPATGLPVASVTVCPTPVASGAATIWPIGRRAASSPMARRPGVALGAPANVWPADTEPRVPANAPALL